MGLKILIVRFSSIGDIVLTTPVIRALRTSLDAEVHYATKQKFSSVLKYNPYLEKVHCLGDDFKAFSNALKAENFDAVIDLHKNLRTLRLRLALRKPWYAFDKLNFEKWLLVNLKIDKLPNVHIVDRYLAPAIKLGAEPDALGLDFFLGHEDEVEREWLPETHRKGYVAFSIGGQHATKRLPTSRIIDLCERINQPVILLGGKEDSAVGEEIAAFFQVEEREAKSLEEMGKRTVIFNACGKFTLGQSAFLLKNARAVFTHDTGLMHIAAAFRKKIYSIWGNTVPEFGMYPYRTNFVIYEKKGLSCRPCSKIGHAACPKGHFKCMEDITFDFWQE